jgi:hypothetical protein
MNIKQVSTALVLSAIGASAFAAGTGPSAGDLSNLTPDVTTILAAIGAVAAAAMGVVLCFKGAGLIKRAFGLL